MTPEERERMDVLCRQIATEKDHNKFTQLTLVRNIVSVCVISIHESLAVPQNWETLSVKTI